MTRKYLRIAYITAIVFFCAMQASAEFVDTTITVGTSPQGVAVNSVTNKIYVANNDSTVTVIDGATNTTTTVTVGTYPRAVAVNSVTNKIYVTNQYVTVIDGVTNSTTSVSAGQSPYAVAVNSVTDKIYVVNQNSNNVSVINGATNATTAVTVGTFPCGVAVNSVTNKIYVANQSSNNVTVIDGATNATSTVTAGSAPYFVAVNSVTNKIYVLNQASGSVTVIDGATNATSTVTTGSGPQGVAVNSVTNKIYVANQYSNNVTVIDGATNATATVNAGSAPYDIAVNSVTNKIYVANANGSNVTVINGATNTTATVTVGSNPQGVAVNSVTNKMYVVNAYSKTVSVINGANIGNVTLTFPTNNADNVLLRPTLRWNAATYATAYNVQVSTNSAFDMNTITIDSRSVSDTLTVFLNAGTKYYWRVAGTHGSSTGSWTTDSFTTAQIAPSAPILASPANGAIDVDLNPRLIWNAGPDATTYHVQLSNTSSFSFAKDTAGNGYTCALKSLTPYTTYYWRVNVSNFYGTSPWSAVDSFTTVASEPPSIPVLNTPSNGSSTPTNPGLTWNSCNYASTYEVQVSNSSTFSIIMDTVERGTSWKLVPLPVRSTYYWRVRASNAIGTSSWSSVWNFTTTNAGISDNKKPQYTGAAIGYSGILAIYSINGKRVMQMSFEATATKARLLKDAVKSLAKGAYVYRLNKNGEIVSQANMFVQ